ncbi:21048_t:CDS:1, partial [Gigaspora rosea]
WIELETKEQRVEEGSLPRIIEQLNRDLVLKKIEKCPTYPIRKQEEILEAMEVLRNNYRLESVPKWLFDVNELPEPNWEIFDKQINVPIIVQDLEMENNVNDELSN